MGKNENLVPHHSSGYCTSSPGCCKAYEGGGGLKRLKENSENWIYKINVSSQTNQPKQTATVITRLWKDYCAQMYQEILGVARLHT